MPISCSIAGLCSVTKKQKNKQITAREWKTDNTRNFLVFLFVMQVFEWRLFALQGIFAILILTCEIVSLEALFRNLVFGVNTSSNMGRIIKYMPYPKLLEIKVLHSTLAVCNVPLLLSNPSLLINNISKIPNPAVKHLFLKTIKRWTYRRL